MDRYEEALKRAKEFVGKEECINLEYIFPELKESEDEQHRKWILEYLYDGLRKSDEQFKGHFKAAISWLEKQSQKETTWSEEDKDMLGAIAYCIKNNRPLEKEHLAWLEKQSEKPEPKFDVGDWIVYCDEDTDQITGLYDKGYEVNGCGYIPFECEDDMRRWTIRDAKDGDVLITTNDERPFIYKGCLDLNHPDSPVAYGGVDSKGYFCRGGNTNHWWTDEEVHPATKEQHDQLEKAMADAGYTFDFEKKEMKKIEQNPAEWSEEGERIKNALIKIFEHRNQSFIDELTNYSGNIKREEVLAWLKSIRPRNTWKPSDEQMMILFIYAGQNNKDGSILTSLYKDLKKL